MIFGNGAEKVMQRGTDYDWQQKAFKVELLHDFLTTRLSGLWNNLPIGGISLAWSLKAKSKFPGKRYVEKEVTGFTQKLPSKIVHM